MRGLMHKLRYGMINHDTLILILTLVLFMISLVRNVRLTALAALSSWCRNNVPFHCRIIPIVLETISLTPLIESDCFCHHLGATST
jgi:hypothetical protein